MKAASSAAFLLIAVLAGCGTAADILPPMDDILPPIDDLLPLDDILPSRGEVRTVGPDTFSVSASDLDPTVPTRVALVKAQNYCASLGRETLTKNITVDPRWEKMGRRPVATVTFQCLTKDQLEQARRREAKPPDVPAKESSK